ncbi:MAG: helix-turn-helix domain-containing protein [Candidatus Ornithomonoglobus sp.]
MDFEELGARLVDLRTNRRLKQKEVAEATGISKSTLSKIENGFADTSFTNIVKLAQFYNVSVDYLLGLKRHDKIMQSEMSELGLSDKAIWKLKKNTRHAKILSELILTNSIDEFLDRIEIFLNGNMEAIYLGLTKIYEKVITELREQQGEALPDDTVMNILKHGSFNDAFDRFKIREALNALLNELKKKYGNEISADKSVNSPLNILLRNMDASVDDSGEKKPKLRDILKGMVEAAPEEKREMLNNMLDAIDTAQHMQNYTLKHI